jgi:hypothetical protein
MELIDGYIDEWMDERMFGWIDGCLDERMDG